MSRCSACRCERIFAQSAGVEPPDPGEDLYAYAWVMGAAFVLRAVRLVRLGESAGIELCPLHTRDLRELLEEHAALDRTMTVTSPVARPTKEN